MTNEIKKKKTYIKSQDVHSIANSFLFCGKIGEMIARLQTNHLFFFDGDYYEANWNEMHLFCQYLVKHKNR